MSGEDRSNKLDFSRLDIPADFIGPVQRESSENSKLERKLLSSVTSAVYVTVQFTLGRKLDEGGTGMVYEVISSPIDSQGSAGAEIPPLVAKIGARSKNKRIAREAWFYDELQTLQGVMVPRCYGCFEA